MCAFRADVGCFDREIAAQLMLYRHVPLITRRQAQCFRQDECRHAIRQHWAAVRAFWLVVEDRVGIERLRPLCKRENREIVLRGLIRLNRQHGQILCDVMTEDRAEYADVEASSEAQANNGLIGYSIGDANARRDGCERPFLIQVEANALAACNQHLACVNVDEATFAGARHGLWAIEFPTPPEIHGQVLRHSPVVLAKEKPAVLALFGIESVTEITLETTHIPEQECGKASPATRWPRSASCVEVELARAMAVTRDAQVHRSANIRTEFDRVIASHIRPVIDELKLPLVLPQRAVAC